MQTATPNAAIQAAPTSIAGAMQALQAKYPPLQAVTRPNLKTEEAAHYLNRRPQTLRVWACLENGPIRPRRIGGLLAWPTVEVKALAGVA
jgi:hypothetical protein